MKALSILFMITGLLLFIYATAQLIALSRQIKYQKIWNQRKANIRRINPAITTMELCAMYVRFCKVNHCKVEF